MGLLLYGYQLENEFFWCLACGGKFVRSNYAIFRVHHRVLSPIEVAVVLIHTLSSDIHSIYDYVKALYVQFKWHGPEDVWMLEGSRIWVSVGGTKKC